MGTESPMMPDKTTIKQLGRRRVFAFFWSFVILALASSVVEEGDIFLHVVDDYADIILAVVALIVLIAWWRRTSESDLKRVNNILAVLAVLLIFATIFAITQEYNDPMDFGNEIPTLFFGIFLVINRFL